jgi:hypothetical protein
MEMAVLHQVEQTRKAKGKKQAGPEEDLLEEEEGAEVEGRKGLAKDGVIKGQMRHHLHRLHPQQGKKMQGRSKLMPGLQTVEEDALKKPQTR